MPTINYSCPVLSLPESSWRRSANCYMAALFSRNTVAAPVIRTQPAAPAILYPEPPSLHWGIVLALGFITCGLFGWVWAFVQAGFVKKVDPSSKALLYYALAVAGFVLAIVMNVSRQFVPLAGLIQLTGTVLFIGVPSA